MYYPTPESLPEDLRSALPLEASELYRLTFNAAYDAEKADFEQAGRIAWTALLTHFEQRPDGTWVHRNAPPPRL